MTDFRPYENLNGPASAIGAAGFTLGYQFSVTATCWATKLWYWRVDSSCNPNVIGLWDNSGNLVTQVTAPASSVTQEWVSITLPAPAQLVAGTYSVGGCFPASSSYSGFDGSTFVPQTAGPVTVTAESGAFPGRYATGDTLARPTTAIGNYYVVDVTVTDTPPPGVAFGGAGAMASHATAGPITAGLPAGTTTDDVLHLSVYAVNTSTTAPTINTPTGWALLQTATVARSTTHTLRHSVFRRVVPAGGISAPSVSSNAGGGTFAVITRYAGADPTTPEDAVVPAATTGSATSPLPAPAVTTATPGAMVGHYYVQLDNRLLTSPNNSAVLSYGGLDYSTTTGADVCMGGARKAMPNPGSSGVTSITSDATSTLQYVGISVAIRPLPAKTAVGATRRVRSAVRSRATATTAGRWSVRARLAVTRTARFAVRSRLGQFRLAQWALRRRLAATSTARWQLLARAATSRVTRWSQRTRLATASGVHWSVRRTSPDTGGLRWATRISTGLARTVLWRARTTRGATRPVSWSVRATALDPADLVWTSRQPVSATAPVRWSTRRPVGAVRTARWAGRAGCATTAEPRWAARAALRVDTDLAWSALVSTRAAGAVRWAGRVTVPAEHTARWASRDSAGTGRPLEWASRQRFRATGRVRYGVQAEVVVGQTGTAVWNTRTLATSTASARWQVRVPAVASRSTSWAVRRSTSTSVETRWAQALPVLVTRAIGWSARTRTGATRAARWTGLAATTALVPVRWSSRTVLEQVAEVAWESRTRTATARPVNWAARQRASGGIGAVWAVRAPVPVERDLVWSARIRTDVEAGPRWAARTLAGRDAPARWSVRDPAGVAQPLRWSAQAGTLAARAGVWSTRALATGVGRLTWRARGRAGADGGDIRWSVRSALGAAATASWDTRQRTAAAPALQWDITGTPDQTLRPGALTATDDGGPALQAATAGAALTATYLDEPTLTATEVLA